MSNRHSLLIAPLLAACIAVAQEPQPPAAPARNTVTISRTQPAVPLRQHTSVRVVCHRLDQPRATL